MTIKVIDTATTQRNMDFAKAKREGWASAYVKLGGDNVGRYVAPHYVSEVDRARGAGMRVGHYWVPNADYDPISAADYFVNNLRGWTSRDYAVLDNESLDGAHRYSDAQAAAWINRVKSRLRISGKQVKHYSGLHDARSTAWPKVLATGANFIIAAYSYAPFAFPPFATVPFARIDGHQYSSTGTVGGVSPVDLNAFKDTAFDYSAGTSTPAAIPDSATSKEIEVIHYHREDKVARKSGRTIKPGEVCYLNEANAINSQATNIVGGIGTYSITPHVYAEGAAGDVVDVILLWDDTKTKGPHSAHYTVRGTIDKTGHVALSPEFKRAVERGYAVYVQVKAPTTNAKPVKVTLIDSDSFLFKA